MRNKILSIILISALFLVQSNSAIVKANDLNKKDVLDNSNTNNFYDNCDKLILQSSENIHNTMFTVKDSSKEKKDNTYKNALKKENKKLDLQFDSYEIDKNTIDSYEQDLNIDFNSIFGSDIPNEFFIYIPKENTNIENQTSKVSTLASTVTHDPQFVYVFASTYPSFYKVGGYDVYAGSSQTVATALNRVCNIVIGYTTTYTWAILTALGIDLSTISPNYTTGSSVYEMDATATWFRKYCMVWDNYSSSYRAGSSDGVVNYTLEETARYFDNATNYPKVVRKTTSGGKQSPHYEDNNYLISIANSRISNGSSPYMDETGSISFSYNYNTVILLTEDLWYTSPY